MRVALRLVVVAVVVAVVAVVASVVGGDQPTPSTSSDGPSGGPTPAATTVTSPEPAGRASSGPDDPSSAGTALAATAVDAIAWCLPQRSTIDGSSLVLAVPPDGEPVAATSHPLRRPDEVVAVEVVAGQATTRSVDPPTDALEVGADGGLVAARVSTFPRGPAGTIAGPCPTDLVAEAVIPGMGTADGSSALVAIGNPSDHEVAVAFDLLTPDGRELPDYMQFIPIAPGATTVVFADDVASDREDLAVRVRADDGRVAVTAMRQQPGTTGPVAGRTAVVAPAAPAPSWILPWVATAGDPAAGLGDPGATTGAVDTTLWVANPGTEPATVRVDLTTSDGRVPTGAPVPPVPPDGVVRVDLAADLADLTGDVGAVVISDADTPVVVAAGTEVVAGDTPQRTGIATVTGHPGAATSWVAVGPSGPGRRHLVTITNPGDGPATVAVSAAGGHGAITVSPPGGLAVPPGATTTVEVPAPVGDDPTLAVFVTATTGAVVTSLRSGLSGPGPLDLVHAAAAAPAG